MDNVLKPDLQWIDGKCYRINPGNFGSYTLDSEERKYHEEEMDSCPLEYESGEEDDDIEFNQPDGRFKLNVHVAASYFSYIIGGKGMTRKRLESETQARIDVPKQGRSGDIIITGADKRSVRLAKRRIQMLVASARKRQQPTHFIAIPLNSDSIQSGFLDFKSQVLEKFKGDSIDEDLFQSPIALHMTIGVLVLSDEFERREASAALDKCKTDVISPLLKGVKLELEVAGVDYFGPDPSSVKMLFAKVHFKENPKLLQELANGIMQYFINLGTMKAERESVNIHATLMNMSFRERGEFDKRRQKTFDATEILNCFGGFVFGTTTVDKIDLCLMHRSDKSAYYAITASIAIP